MALKDPKIIIGAALLGAALFSSTSKASTKNTGSSSGNTGNGDLPKPPGNGPSEEGQAAGPNGCKPGLIIENGICKKPSQNGNQGNQSGNQNGGGGGITSSSLTISSKCDNFTFGDKTGNAWWIKNEKVAQQWVTKGYDNPLQISYGMLLKNKEVCFKDFPDFDDPQILENGQLEFQLLNWIAKYPKIWELIWWLRNKIDEKFFSGVETVTIDPKTFIYKYGKEYDFDTLWNNTLAPLANVFMAIELENPAKILKAQFQLNNKSFEGDYVFNVTTYLYSLLFPNIPKEVIASRYIKSQLNDKFFDNLWDYVSNINESLDLDFDPNDYGK